ncbi:hypothetical protein [Foetidibacter luteolus]|uniref:hypothetical protein n=1 Tax=Foetidibacter luteolus TaxID=2608880 RepID=UPI00129BCF29|nr:hypothetical protein [Foetidibacter luteolus]
MNLPYASNQIVCAKNFEELVSLPFYGAMNAICWPRKLPGDFGEIVSKTASDENIKTIYEAELCELVLSEQGQLAREVLLSDLKLLEEHGASPILNVIRCYERDDACLFFPTDVYSFHVDRSTVPADTFLCTYYGAPSEIIPNPEAQQKVLVPEIRNELKKLYRGADEGFESFLREHFFDLHYSARPGATVTSLGLGNLCRLAVDYPGSKVSPCVHRAPKEEAGQHRLLMIC